MDFQSVIDQIPDFQRFFRVDEMDRRSLQLAKDYPERVEVMERGRSREGNPIYVIKIGSGSKNALLFGCPHPNEPIGAMMLEVLSELLAKNDPALQELDYTWYLIKSIDIDGTKRNEGWFDDSSSIRKYAEHFYRPASFEQVEWTFPVDYKTLHFHKPLPETQVLMEIIQEKKPVFMYSLHNSGFGGVYYYVSGTLTDSLFDLFQAIPGHFQLPLNLGEPEVPYLKPFAPAIFPMFGISDEYDYLEKHLPEGMDPATVIQAGTSSDDYAKKMAGTYSLVCEMPYYFDPRVNDQTTVEQSRRHFLEKAVQSGKENYDRLHAIFSSIESAIHKKDSPFFTAVHHYLSMIPNHLAAQENWIKTDETLQRPATKAEEFDNLYAQKFYNLLMQGMMRRMIRENLTTAPGNASMKEALENADRYFEETVDFLEKNLTYQTIPIKKLVSVQMLAGLHTMKTIQDQNQANPEGMS